MNPVILKQFTSQILTLIKDDNLRLKLKENNKK